MLCVRQISITREVATYFQRKLFIQKALGQDIINYNALARKIAQELGTASTEAIKSALIRVAKKYKCCFFFLLL